MCVLFNFNGAKLIASVWTDFLDPKVEMSPTGWAEIDELINALPIFVLVFSSSLYMLRATHVYVAWSEGLNWPITSSLVTSSVVTLLKTGMLTLFLYQRILGNGDPVAEQLTRIEAPIFDTLNEAGGFDTNEGDSKSRNN